jgi:hypothetical protein
MSPGLGPVKATPGSNSWNRQTPREGQGNLTAEPAMLIPVARMLRAQQQLRLAAMSGREPVAWRARPFGLAVTVRACLLGVMWGGRSVLLSLRTRVHGKHYSHARQRRQVPKVIPRPRGRFRLIPRTAHLETSRPRRCPYRRGAAVCFPQRNQLPK